MNHSVVGMMGILALIILMFLDMPVAFSMFITGFIGFAVISGNINAGLKLFASEMTNTLTNYDLGVVILFSAMGALVGNTGIADRLFDFFYKTLGRLSGGLAMGTLAACSLFGAVCGSSNAAAITFGKVVLPSLKKYGYSDELSTATVACGSTMSSLIPPSLVFIIFGIVTQQSIGKLFISGFAPGILLTILLIIDIWVVAKIKPGWGPPGPKFTFKEIFKSAIGVVEAFLLFIFVLGGLFGGIITPTEAGAIGCVGAIAISAIRRKLTVKGFISAFKDTAQAGGMIFLILIGAFVFGRFLAISNIGIALTNWIQSAGLPPQIDFLIIVVIFIIAGMLMDTLAIILIFVPLLLPLVRAMGYDIVWFGVLNVLLAQIGQLTPPVGTTVFGVKAVAPEIPIWTIYRGTLYFYPMYLIVTLLVIFFPGWVLWLPNLIKY